MSNSLLVGIRTRYVVIYLNDVLESGHVVLGWVAVVPGTTISLSVFPDFVETSERFVAFTGGL